MEIKDEGEVLRDHLQLVLAACLMRRISEGRLRLEGQVCDQLASLPQLATLTEPVCTILTFEQDIKGSWMEFQCSINVWTGCARCLIRRS